MTTPSFEAFPVIALAVDPVHVGTGGARLGRVDLTIVRDPVTRVPKIPGSSLAGVYRAYGAMALSKYPRCAGLGQPDERGQDGHCGQADCPICTVFGFARGRGGGFAGLAGFSDAQVLLFPVATRQGPLWVTCPGALRFITCELDDRELEDALYRSCSSPQPLNLGWLRFEVKKHDKAERVAQKLEKLQLPDYIRQRWGILSDKLFSHVVNSNLEVRTSVSIDPKTGAAEEGALFSYEALPRATVLVWEIICKNPAHFRVGEKLPKPENLDGVYNIAAEAHPYLEQLGIGGMGTRGMGRLRVLSPPRPSSLGDRPHEQVGGT